MKNVSLAAQIKEGCLIVCTSFFLGLTLSAVSAILYPAPSYKTYCTADEKTEADLFKTQEKAWDEVKSEHKAKEFYFFTISGIILLLLAFLAFPVSLFFLKISFLLAGSFSVFFYINSATSPLIKLLFLFFGLLLTCFLGVRLNKD